MVIPCKSNKIYGPLPRYSALIFFWAVTEWLFSRKKVGKEKCPTAGCNNGRRCTFYIMDMFMFHVSLQPSTASNHCQACNVYYRNIIIKPYKMIHSGIFKLITFYSLLILRAFLSVSLLILFSFLCQWLKLFSYL